MLDELLEIPTLEIYKELFKRREFDFITVKNGLKHEKQELALTILTDQEHSELYYGGAAGGAKSWTGCSWLHFMCECYPETKWFIGREELKTLLSTTFVTFRKVGKAYGVTDWNYNGQYNYVEYGNGSRIDLLDLKFLPNEDPLYERYGSSEYTGGLIDEVGQVHVNAYDVLKSRVGRHLNDFYGLLRKLALTGNPKKNFSYEEFYKKDKEGQLEPYKAFIKALLYDNPHRESGYEASLLTLSNEATKQRLLYGNFEYDDDPASLISYEKILDCFTNTWAVRGEKYITCDVARFGADRTVIGIWSNYRVKMYTYKGLDVKQTADKIKEFQEQYQVPNSRTIADEDGVGGGVVDILKCKGFVNNSRPLDNPKTHEDENYSNLKSQCYFRLAERINQGGVFIDCDDIKVKADIIQELEQVKQHNMDKDGKRQVVPKDKVKEMIGRSPDYSDTLMMREWFELAPKMKPAVW